MYKNAGNRLLGTFGWEPYAKKFAGPLAQGVSDLLIAGLFVKLSFEIVSPGSPGPRQRSRRAGVEPALTSVVGRRGTWDPPFGTTDGHQTPSKPAQTHQKCNAPIQKLILISLKSPRSIFTPNLNPQNLKNH